MSSPTSTSTAAAAAPPLPLPPPFGEATLKVGDAPGRSWITILFSVSVPVLSEQSTLRPASSSTAARRATMAPCAASSCRKCFWKEREKKGGKRVSFVFLSLSTSLSLLLSLSPLHSLPPSLSLSLPPSLSLSHSNPKKKRRTRAPMASVVVHTIVIAIGIDAMSSTTTKETTSRTGSRPRASR